MTCSGAVEVKVAVTGQIHYLFGIIDYRAIDRAAGVAVKGNTIAGNYAVKSVEVSAERERKARSHQECSCFVFKADEFFLIGQVSNGLAIYIALKDDLICFGVIVQVTVANDEANYVCGSCESYDVWCIDECDALKCNMA